MRFCRGSIAIVLVVLACELAGAAPPRVEPLLNAHAHNDYLHLHPLFDALDHGFTSIEADVFCVGGKLLVGHDRDKLNPAGTLESLYLAPLAERVQQNGGHVYAKSARFFLLIDIKDDPQRTYRELQKLLAKHSEMLTSVAANKILPGSVTVVLTGNRPKIASSDPHLRFVGLDGRLSDLDSEAPAHLMPMISDNWKKQFHWTGEAPMPQKERAKLRGIVKKAHATGRVVRFWETPEHENVWRELRSADVDLIGTDELGRLETFLRSINAERQHP